MFQRLATLLIGLSLAFASVAADNQWVEGKHYVRLDPAQTTATGDKIEVLEVFSYGCPHCSEFQSVAETIRKALPGNSELRYLPAGFGRPAWETFARAYYATEALGIVDRTHKALFAAIYSDKKIDALKPTLEQIAAVAAQAGGVKADDVLAAAQSFAINTRLKRGEAQVRAMAISGTPTVVVNGKYRIDSAAVGSNQALIELVKYLVAKEGGK